MQTVQLLLVLLAAVALAAAAPSPDSYADYQYEDYDYGSYEDDDESDAFRLRSSVFDDLRPHRVKADSPLQSACSWAVVQCCAVPGRMGKRANCFHRLGCPGAWFSDICDSTIQKNIFKSVLSAMNGH